MKKKTKEFLLYSATGLICAPIAYFAVTHFFNSFVTSNPIYQESYISKVNTAIENQGLSRCRVSKMPRVFSPGEVVCDGKLFRLKAEVSHSLVPVEDRGEQK
ncbi:hypothetical protein ACFL0X_01945 [Nanoarchaeota archaeon]